MRGTLAGPTGLVLLLAAGAGFAMVVLAVLGGGASPPPASTGGEPSAVAPSPTPVPPLTAPTLVAACLESEPCAYARAVSRPAAEWLGFSPEPPAACALPDVDLVTGDGAEETFSGAAVGPLYLVGGPVILPHPVGPSARALWRVDASAGASVVISGARVTDGLALLFWYDANGHNVAVDQHGTDQLVLTGPFELSDWLSAIGYVIPPGPGCYEIVVTSDAGQATANVWVAHQPLAEDG